MVTTSTNRGSSRGDTGREGLSLDDLFHSLKNERRRRVLRYLIESDGEEFEMRDIAERVASAEYDTAREFLGSDQRKRVYIALYQCHLPQLADVGLIDYDQNRGVVTSRDELAQVVAYLPETEGDEGSDICPTAPIEKRDHSGRLSDRRVQGSVAVTAVALLALLAVWVSIFTASTALSLVVILSIAVTGLSFAVDE